MPTVTNREAVHADLRKRFGATVTRKQLFAYRDETGIYPVWIRTDDKLRIDRGLYKIPPEGYASNIPVNVTNKNAEKAAALKLGGTVVLTDDDTSTDVSAEAPRADDEVQDTELPEAIDASKLKSLSVHQRLDLIRKQASLLAEVPAKFPAFVPFGHFATILSIVKSRKFFPVFVTGLSGNGKTLDVEQACAIAGREYIRVNITQETDEDDLLGGFRLVDGNTVFEVGPVIVAMVRGAVLLVDEIDYASAKIAAIQSVLEGRKITLKKLGITIAPTPGFTVFATANTKGKGDETGQFVGTNLLNEAFLERFALTIEQEYADVETEKKILAKTLLALGYTLTEHAKVFIDTLAKWSNAIRKTYLEGGVDSVISTRRLVHIIGAYGLFGANDEATEKALDYCLNRFDTKVKDAFADLWNKLAPDPGAPVNVGSLDGIAID